MKKLFTGLLVLLAFSSLAQANPNQIVSPNNSYYENDFCGIKPNGNCLTGDTIGGYHTTNRCLSESEVISRVKENIRDGICTPPMGTCRLRPNGNCLTGVTINGVHFTNKCLSEKKARTYLRQLKRLRLCR